MIKILVKSDDNGNTMDVLEPAGGVKAIDVLTTLGSPLMSVVLSVCDNDREAAIEILTELLDSYTEANDIDEK